MNMNMKDSQPQDMCPICTKPFADKDVVIRYSRWDKKWGKPGASAPDSELGHLRCVLGLSQMETKK
jgi:hypothetical protein